MFAPSKHSTSPHFMYLGAPESPSTSIALCPALYLLGPTNEYNLDQCIILVMSCLSQDEALLHTVDYRQKPGQPSGFWWQPLRLHSGPHAGDEGSDSISIWGKDRLTPLEHKFHRPGHRRVTKTVPFLSLASEDLRVDHALRDCGVRELTKG